MSVKISVPPLLQPGAVLRRPAAVVTGALNHPLYQALLAATDTEAPVRSVQIGLAWTQAQVDGGHGFAFSPRQAPRTLEWAGTLAGQSSLRLRHWLCSSNEAEAAVGLAVLNASLNAAPDALAREARPLRHHVPGHLQVFAHFRARLRAQRVVVIGRYPGLAEFWSDVDYACIERQPQAGDWPETAAGSLLPLADWVFITGSALANHSLPELLRLSRHATVVLMGPSTPWWPGWMEQGVRYLAGVQVLQPQKARQVVAEGGGTRLFAGPVRYGLLDLQG